VTKRVTPVGYGRDLTGPGGARRMMTAGPCHNQTQTKVLEDESKCVAIAMARRMETASHLKVILRAITETEWRNPASPTSDPEPACNVVGL
jgi:hypothetical protein